MQSSSREQDIFEDLLEGSPGGTGPPPLGFKVSKFWAILYHLGNIALKFWQFHIFRASLRQNFGQFNLHQTVSISVKTFFFFGGHLNLNRKTNHLPGKIQCHFSGKSLVLPQILLSYYAHACRLQSQGLELRGQGLQNVSSRTPPLI